MRWAVYNFRGSNCDQDAFHVVKNVLGQPVEYLWHKQSRDLAEFDAIIVPGGFSYGDYLRCGAIARFSPIMQDVRKAAADGKWCWGFAMDSRFSVKRACSPVR